jgi:2-haloacid dehalogenase
MTVSLIFDVGGVLIDWNPRHLYRRLFDGDGEAMERFLAEVCTPEWNARQDAGRPFSAAIAELVAQFPEHASLIAAYDACWEEMVPHAHEDTLAMVRALKHRGVSLYCLTNFSTEKFPLVQQRWNVFDLFDGIVVSGEIGLIKPDPAIFRHLLQRFGLQARECVFVDDVEANVCAARTVGMRGIRYHSSVQLRYDLRALGIVA